jgi:hypothetical protein
MTKCVADALLPTDPSGSDDQQIRLSAGTRQRHSWYVDVALTPNGKRGLAGDDQAESVVDHRLCCGLLVRACLVSPRKQSGFETTSEHGSDLRWHEVVFGGVLGLG